MWKIILVCIALIGFTACSIDETDPESGEVVKIYSDSSEDLIYINSYVSGTFTTKTNIPDESTIQEIKLYLIKDSIEYPLYSNSCDFWNDNCSTQDDIICTKKYSEVSDTYILECRDDQEDYYNDGTTTTYYLEDGTIDIYGELVYIGSDNTDQELTYHMMKWEFEL